MNSLPDKLKSPAKFDIDAHKKQNSKKYDL